MHPIGHPRTDNTDFRCKGLLFGWGPSGIRLHMIYDTSFASIFNQNTYQLTVMFQICGRRKCLGGEGYSIEV